MVPCKSSPSRRPMWFSPAPYSVTIASRCGRCGRTTGVPREYRISITVRVEARDRRTGETVLKSTEVEGKSDVLIGEDQQSAEMQALPLLADDIAKRVAGLLVESWLTRELTLRNSRGPANVG